MTKFEGIRIFSWQSLKLANWGVDQIWNMQDWLRIWSWPIKELAKFEGNTYFVVDRIQSWPNLKLDKFEVCQLSLVKFKFGQMSLTLWQNKAECLSNALAYFFHFVLKFSRNVNTTNLDERKEWGKQFYPDLDQFHKTFLQCKLKWVAKPNFIFKFKPLFVSAD